MAQGKSNHKEHKEHKTEKRSIDRGARAAYMTPFFSVSFVFYVVTL